MKYLSHIKIDPFNQNISDPSSILITFPLELTDSHLQQFLVVLKYMFKIFLNRVE